LKFSFVHRGYEKWLLLLPGWAFMPDIFSRLALGFNYILPKEPLVDDITSDVSALPSLLETDQIHVLGWSLGATVAALLCIKIPELIADVCLISVMKHFQSQDADKILTEIYSDRRGAVERFHRLCFTGQRDDLAWFRSTLQENTLKAWDTSHLRAGLSFLVNHPFEQKVFQTKKTVYFHGSRDIVAPLEQAPGKGQVNVIKGAGHLPFLTERFHRLYESWQKTQDS